MSEVSKIWDVSGIEGGINATSMIIADALGLLCMAKFGMVSSGGSFLNRQQAQDSLIKALRFTQNSHKFAN